MTEETPTQRVVKKSDYLGQLKKLIENGPQRAALFTHSGPDPDGIGAMMGMAWLLSRLGIESDLYYTGSVSHPQNAAMVNLLDPDLKLIDEYIKGYDLHVLVDAVPANAGVDTLEIKWDVVIDHHKEFPNGGFNGIFINLKAGSACATVYSILQEWGYEFEDGKDIDSKVATALMIGMVTDTENLMSDNATEYEFRAWSDLFEFRDSTSLKRIVNYERPKFWIEKEAAAVTSVNVVEGVAIVGLGIIPGKHRDMIADMASQMLTWEDVHTALAFAIVDGDRMVGCVRSQNASVLVPQLCKALGGKYGAGGGKLGKGAYRYDLGGAGIDEEDDDATAQETWDLFNKKEIKRIKRVVQSE